MIKNYRRRNNGSYTIQKQINNKIYYFGTYQTEEETKKTVEFLRKQNWNPKYAKKQKKRNYIYKRNRNYTIYKKGKYYGTYKTREEAEKAVEFFKEHDWNPDYVKYKNDKSKYIGKYISKNVCGNYVISKWIDGKQYIFGTFHNLEDAEKERNLLIKYDWDWDLVCDSGL